MDWDAAGVEQISIKFEREKCLLTPTASAVTRKCAGETDVTDDGDNKTRPYYQEEFANHDISCVFAERAHHLYLEKSDGSTEHLKLDKQGALTGYRNSPVPSRGSWKLNVWCRSEYQ